MFGHQFLSEILLLIFFFFFLPLTNNKIVKNFSLMNFKWFQEEWQRKAAKVHKGKTSSIHYCTIVVDTMYMTVCVSHRSIMIDNDSPTITQSIF